MRLEELMDRTHLGDGLYAGHDGYNIWLHAERDGRVHAVALEPEVLHSLDDYRRRLGHGREPRVTER